jgi:D-psicose/D-tagatose/L-ribulose 3-epimerase
MELGISTWVWTSPADDEVLARLIPRIAEMGYDAVEIPIETLGQFDIARARQLADAAGLGVSVCAVIGPGRDLLLDDEVEVGLGYLRGCIDAAQALGSPAVAGPFYSAVGRCWPMSAAERAREIDKLAERLRDLAVYGAERGVELGVEPLNRFETSFFNTTEQTLELVERVNHPGLGVALDVFHLGIEEKSLGEAIRRAEGRLKHVQVAENDRGTPGTGQLAWDEVAQALNDVGYHGRVVIETFSDRVEAIARAAAIWRPLAPDSDTLAREGLAFLRGLLGDAARA